MNSPAGARLAVIILNFKRAPETEQCLESLLLQTYRDFTTVVLNHDPDGDRFRCRWPGVEVLDIPHNRGYAGNNNIGLRHTLKGTAEWFLLLNEDTVLDPRCLEELMRVADSDPRIGMLGPLILHRDTPDRIQSAGCHMPPNWLHVHIGRGEPDTGQFVEPHEVDWLQGCALMVRRQVVETVGVLDERYFMYMEEIDWCMRAKRQGWRVVNVPRARLWHAGTWPGPPPRPAVTYYMFRNRFLLLGRNRAPLRAWLAAANVSLRTLAGWTVRPRWRHMRPHRDALWQAIRDAAALRWGAGPYGN